MKYTLSNMRLTGNNKYYYASQMQQFADKLDTVLYKSVAFGKQDIRGGISITLFDHKHGAPQQRHFSSKDEMLGFIVASNLYAIKIISIQG